MRQFCAAETDYFALVFQGLRFSDHSNRLLIKKEILTCVYMESKAIEQDIKMKTLIRLTTHYTLAY